MTPEKRSQIEAMFIAATFVQSTGIIFKDVGPGWCESALTIKPEHGQQNGYVHAGVCATMADHTAGAAAMSLAPEGFGVLSIEFKINLLRPAVGSSLRCRATVLKAGRTVSFVEAEVFADEKLVAKASATMAIVPWKG